MAQTLLRVSTGNEEIGRYVNEEEQRSCACSHLQLLCYLRLSMELQLQHTTVIVHIVIATELPIVVTCGSLECVKTTSLAVAVHHPIVLATQRGDF
jgi:hypothetical protein